MSTLPIAFDDGTSAQVPMSKVPAALADGGKVVQAMRFDDGTTGYVPLENVHSAMQDGGTVIGAPPTRPNISMPLPGALSRGATAFGAQAGDLLQAGALAAGGGSAMGRIGTPSEPQPPSLSRDVESVRNAGRGLYNLVAEPIQRARQGDVAGGIGEGLANIPALISLGKSGYDVANSKVGQSALETGKFAGRAANVLSFNRLEGLYQAAQDTLSKIRDIWTDHPEIAPPEEPQPTYSYRNAGAGQRDVIRPKLLPQETGIQNADFEPIYTQNRALLSSGQQPPSSVPDLPFLRALRPSLTNLPPEQVGPPPVPNPRVLAGNEGMITTPLGLLPEYHPITDAAFMNPEQLRYSQPAQFSPGVRDSLDDAAIRDAMEADLTSHGNAALAEESRQFRAGNDISTPKWLLNAQQRANQVMRDAEARATRPVRYTKTPPLSKFPASPAPATDEDLTPLLEKSLEAVRKKKGGK